MRNKIFPSFEGHKFKKEWVINKQYLIDSDGSKPQKIDNQSSTTKVTPETEWSHFKSVYVKSMASHTSTYGQNACFHHRVNASEGRRSESKPIGYWAQPSVNKLLSCNPDHNSSFVREWISSQSPAFSDRILIFLKTAHLWWVIPEGRTFNRMQRKNQGKITSSATISNKKCTISSKQPWIKITFIYHQWSFIWRHSYRDLFMGKHPSHVISSEILSSSGQKYKCLLWPFL